MPVTRQFHSEFRAWQNMKQRCYNPNEWCFPRYGGRGIIVCKRWLHSFANFLEDMGPKPSPKLSLDRINNDGNYEPNNCRWATWSQQKKNSTSGSKCLDITGHRFNRLVAQHMLPKTSNISRWQCLCDCGNTCVVPVGHLRSGHTRSCGCLQRDVTIARNKGITLPSRLDEQQLNPH